MAQLLNSRSLSNTYKDDFADSDGYHRILFNSGRPLQARELTQMQTIIQEQIKRFGSNIFKEGGVVKPGERILNTGYEFVKLNTTTYGLPSDTSSLVGTTFTGNTSGVTARIIEVVPAGDGDPATIYVAYTNGPASQAGTRTVRFAADETITNGSTTLRVQLLNTTSNPAVGTGTRLSIGSGIYFAKGFFVFTEAQSVIVAKYIDNPSEIVGYKIIEDIITVDDTQELYDNQGAVPNTSSPGADRLRIRLEIANQKDITADDNFIPVMSIVDGAVYRVVDLNNSYDIVRDHVATRIKENSGDYIVSPFTLNFEADSEQSHLIANVSDGTAVVDGYRSHHYAPSKIRVAKPVTTLEINNEPTAAAYGNYVLVDASNALGLPDIHTYAKLDIRNNATWASGSKIGECRVRAIAEQSGNLYRYYIFDIQMTGTNNFRDAAAIGTSSTDYFQPEQPNGKTVLYDVDKNDLLFLLPRERSRSLDDIVLTTQRRLQITTTGAGTATVPALTASGETFANSSDWIIAPQGGNIVTTAFVNGTPDGTTTASLNNLTPSTTYDLYVYVRKASATPRTKSIQERTITRTVVGTELQLGRPDIFELIRVREEDSDGKDLRSLFRLDTGQRDNYYGKGKLVLKDGITAPTKPIFVRYKYFDHGTTGDFFCINSYTGQIDYGDIQTYRTTAGEVVQLRDVIDLRSVVDSDGDFISTPDGARLHELPQVNDTISADITYYIPRKDTLVIDTEGNIFFNSGTPNFAPRKPQRRVGTLPLYDILFFGNTINTSDINVTKYDHQRYTMKDIGKLEERVEKLEEVTALSLIESETKNFQVLDSAGNDRTKSGFFVDNFSTQIFSDIFADDYRASIDPQRKYMRPFFFEGNIRMIYDSDQSSNLVKRGDNLILPYEEITYFDQEFASRSVKVNPYEATVYHGDIHLSPSSDEWRNVQVDAIKAVDGGTKLNTKQAVLWNNWQWNWGGTDISDLKVGDKDTYVKNTSSKITTYVNTVVKEETVKKVIGERLLQISLIPFMRSRKVYFKAQGLRPSSRVWVYFAGVRVDDWIKQETFQFCCNDVKDYGTKFNKATQHPEGPTATLTTDSFGALEGSFFIPNTSNIRFRCGVQEFKILDVSADNEKFSGTIARALYAAQGYLDHIEQTIKSTRVLTVEGKTSVQNLYTNSGGGGGRDDGGPSTTSDNCPSDNTNDNSNSCGVGDGPGSGGGASGGCFAAGTLFRMADRSLKRIEHIMPGDIMLGGGSVYAIMQGDGMREEWYNYNGVHITGTHPVYHNGKWVRAYETNSPRIEQQPVYYSLMNGNHLMISEAGHVFTDFVEIGSDVGGRGEWMMELLNERDAKKIA